MDTPVQKALKNPKSMRSAINAMCYQCIYDESGGSGTWRQQVEACTAPSCALYVLRPTSKNSEE